MHLLYWYRVANVILLQGMCIFNMILNLCSYIFGWQMEYIHLVVYFQTGLYSRAYSTPNIQAKLLGHWVIMSCVFFLLSGGSVSNMYAVNVARYQNCPDVKELGLSAMPRLVMFASQEVSTQGLGQLTVTSVNGMSLRQSDHAHTPMFTFTITICLADEDKLP